jgi:hypothetical protein
MLWRFVLSLIFMLLVLPMIVHAETMQPRACMTKHMRDAMTLNRARDSQYRALTKGKSSGITASMIRMEKNLLVGAPLADFWASPYQREGINIVCGDLIDMSHTPEFRAQNPKGKVSPQTYRPVLIKTAKEKLREHLDKNDFAGLAWLADQYVQQIEKNPRYNCLVRHMLESIRRTAALAPRYEQQARRKALLSPLRLSKVLLKSHMDLLEESARIDRVAAPLQAAGVMIICQDVPHIPAP